MEVKSPVTKIPSSWEYPSKVETRTELLMSRRKNSIPHSSFDLDGDGSVGPHDLFLATKFDLDKDGKLNDQERKNALAALHSGYANNFVWGCESSGLNRSFRLVQKRGKVIIDEDFSKIRETYPIPGNSDRNLTKSQLEELRKQDAKKESVKNEQRINTTLKIFLPVDSFLNKDNYILEPDYQSISIKKNIEKKQARLKAGLSIEPIDIKTKEVEYKYYSKPKNISLSDMKVTRRDFLVDKLNESVDFKHKTFYEKIEQEKQYIGISGRLLKDVALERKKQDVHHYENTFGNRTLGIHGRELPKFEDHRQGNDELLSSRGDNFDNPFARRNVEYHKIEPKCEEVAMKPNQIAHEINEISHKNKLNSKFSGFHSNFMPRSAQNQDFYEKSLQLIKSNATEKKQYRFLSTNEITPPITQRLIQKNFSPLSKFKSITSTGFSIR